jgi:hypothetical protein
MTVFFVAVIESEESKFLHIIKIIKKLIKACHVAPLLATARSSLSKHPFVVFGGWLKQA